MPVSDRLLLYALLLGEGQFVNFDLVHPVRAFQKLIDVYHCLRAHATAVIAHGTQAKVYELPGRSRPKPGCR